jgi:hypothetical protein
MSLYVPILKWKAGEISAYKNLNPIISNSVTPLFEVPPPEYDYMQKKDKKNIDEHLKMFGDRYKKYCGSRSCFIDTSLIPEEMRIQDSRLPMELVFDEIRQRRLSAIPVARLEQSDSLTKLIKSINTKDKHGLCLRLTLDQILNSDLELKVETFLSNLRVNYPDVDLLIDLKSPTNFEPIEALAKMLHMLCGKIPKLNSWRSFIISACSFPESLSEFKNPVSEIKRSEWNLYLKLITLLSEKKIRPIFSDYGIRTPEYKRFDPTKMSAPKNKIIYTIDDGWIIYKGSKSNRDGGSSEYHDMSKSLMDSKYFMKKEYSWGDKFIADCAEKEVVKGKTKPGSLTKWLAAGTNHHITKVVNDLSKIFAL